MVDANLSGKNKKMSCISSSTVVRYLHYKNVISLSTFMDQPLLHRITAKADILFPFHHIPQTNIPTMGFERSSLSFVRSHPRDKHVFAQKLFPKINEPFYTTQIIESRFQRSGSPLVVFRKGECITSIGLE